MRRLGTVLLALACAASRSAADAAGGPEDPARAARQGVLAARAGDWEKAAARFHAARVQASSAALLLFDEALALDRAGGRELEAVSLYHAFLATLPPDSPRADGVRRRILALKTRIVRASRTFAGKIDTAFFGADPLLIESDNAADDAAIRRDVAVIQAFLDRGGPDFGIGAEAAQFINDAGLRAQAYLEVAEALLADGHLEIAAARLRRGQAAAKRTGDAGLQAALDRLLRQAALAAAEKPDGCPLSRELAASIAEADRKAAVQAELASSCAPIADLNGQLTEDVLKDPHWGPVALARWGSARVRSSLERSGPAPDSWKNSELLAKALKAVDGLPVKHQDLAQAAIAEAQAAAGDLEAARGSIRAISRADPESRARAYAALAEGAVRVADPTTVQAATAMARREVLRAGAAPPAWAEEAFARVVYALAAAGDPRGALRAIRSHGNRAPWKAYFALARALEEKGRTAAARKLRAEGGRIAWSQAALGFETGHGPARRRTWLERYDQAEAAYRSQGRRGEALKVSAAIGRRLAEDLASVERLERRIAAEGGTP
ncbi:MAG: hypothetical protein HY554_12430 [Elusimicrobia bacterium]|nr:hypothetical protein [Elusimicrobiota bacterium]